MKSLLLAAACALASTAASAHHSPAAYDMAAEVVIEGTIAELTWKNPHVYVTLQTTGPDGQPMRQEVEAVPLSSARAFGLSPELLAQGAQVVVRARPNRRTVGGVVLGLDLTMPDGAIYPLNSMGRGGAVPVVAERADSIAGKWAPPRAAFADYTRTVQTEWPLSDAARAALQDPREAVAFAVTCDVFPPPMTLGTPTLRSIEIGEDEVLITLDADGWRPVRVVHLDQTEHPADLEPSVLGHSIGRWEGETLVIDTVGFAPHPLGLSFGFPSSAGKHLVERLTLTEDGLGLRYELTVEDPDYLTAPATFSTVWLPRPDLEFSDVPCDPQVAARFLEE